MNDFLTMMEERASLRLYSDQVIADKEKDAIIRAAMRSPTAGNMMLYTILEVKDQGLKDKLSKTCDNQPFIAKSSFVLVFLADFQRWYDLYEHAGIPAELAAEGKEIVPPGAGDFHLATQDAVIAAQSACLAAESMGIGSCYIGDIIENIETHRELLDLPPWVFPATMICFGYPKNPDKKIIRPKFSPEAIHHVDSYKRLKGDDFDQMFEPIAKDPKEQAKALYNRKQSSTFMAEMNRSVTKGIEQWVSGKVDL